VKIPQLPADYLSQLPANRSERLTSLHCFIVAQFPEVKLSFKYKMPTYESGSGWVSIASQKHYVSLYTCERKHIQPYIDAHPGVKCGSGCLNFRDSDTIVLDDLVAVLSSVFEPG